MERIKAFAKYLVQNAENVSREIVNFNVRKLEIKIPIEIVEKSVATNSEFLKFLANSLDSNDERVAADFLVWYKAIQDQTQNEYRALQEEISSLVKPYAETRLRLVNMVTKTSIELGLSTEEVVFINNRLSYLLDLSITQVILKQEQLAKEVNKKNKKEITELSSPIVPIQKGMAILPLIGDVDLDRSEHIINNVVPKIKKLDIQCLIIDFSGLITINTDVASRIFTIYNILSLLGIRAIFTGIRPDLATKIVSSGIDFSSLKTFSNVQQALMNLAQQK